MSDDCLRHSDDVDSDLHHMLSKPKHRASVSIPINDLDGVLINDLEEIWFWSSHIRHE